MGNNTRMPSKRILPDTAITRRQIAAFLHRAVTYRSGEPSAAAEVTLNDVEESAWHRPYAARAVSTGVMPAPDGTFNPDGAATRADMAEMMTAAFSRLAPPAEAQGIFTGMEGQPDRTVRAAEALRAAGVTQGCSTSPLRFCPGRPVTEHRWHRSSTAPSHKRLFGNEGEAAGARARTDGWESTGSGKAPPESDAETPPRVRRASVERNPARMCEVLAGLSGADAREGGRAARRARLRGPGLADEPVISLLLPQARRMRARIPAVRPRAREQSGR